MSGVEVKKILVGVDFSDADEPVVADAVAIARHTGAHVCLAYATTCHEPVEGEAASVIATAGHYEDLTRDRIEQARRRLARLRDEVRARGVCGSVGLIEASADVGLIDEADRMGADLIVVGTHGYTGFKRMLMGSVAERVVRGAHTSVMVARARPSSGAAFRRVLVPTDFSERAEHALQMALVLSAPDVEIDLLHVWHVPPVAVPYAAPVSPGPAYADLQQEIAASVQARADELIGRYANVPATLRFRQVEDTPVQGIQQVLSEGDYECVIMGSHGRRGLRRWLLGSVAEQTVRYAPCSVVVVRSRE